MAWKSGAEDPRALIDEVQQQVLPLETNEDLRPILDKIGDSSFVLLGEASHGTSEFYSWRARLSQRLIREKGFNFIAVEGDWPDCYKVNRFVKGYPNSGESAFRVLNSFERWPTWMWANWEVAALADWIRKFNEHSGRRVGFYGLDVYSLWESMHTIIEYLEKKDPEMARVARDAYRCFEPYGEDVQSYAWSTRMTPESCELEVVELLQEMRRRVDQFDGDPEASFNAEQNALVMVNAEKYYRAMVRSDQNSWNVRDEHMADTLDRLVDLHGPGTKAIVWAHNTHVGDARATDMAREGMTNIGQIVRERHGSDNACLVGFGTHHGTVIAGSAWDAPMQVVGVPDAVEGSWENILYQVSQQTGQAAFSFFTEPWRNHPLVNAERGHRAIGVVYNPKHERLGNYVPTCLAHRYDAFLFINETQALHPLHSNSTPGEEKDKKVPETYPWGV